MILASFQRGLAASVVAAVVSLSATSGTSAQSQRPAAPAKPAPATPVTPAKPVAGSKPAAATAKPAAAAKPATAAKPAAAAAAGPAGSTLVVSIGDWGVYTAAAGRSKICYALSQPKERLPKNLNRDPAYLFVSFRPAENVKNELALVLGFTAKDNGAASAAIGTASYALITKDTNAWLKNPAEESAAIVTMGKAQNVIVKTLSGRGNALTDRYSLTGFNAALDRARKECS